MNLIQEATMTNSSLAAKKFYSNNEATSVVILASSITHEIKNHLAAVTLCTELAESRLKNIAKRVKAADYLLSNIQSQIKCIAMGKPSTMDFKRSSITRDISEVLEQYLFGDGEKQLITVPSGDFEYFGNPALTQQILYNLIKNSLTAIRKAGKGNITIGSECGKKYNKLIFKDTAGGIPKKFIPKVFQLFTSQTQDNGGIGIGLAFVKLVMESYCGCITCNSVEGEYTEFVLKFPR